MKIQYAKTFGKDLGTIAHNPRIKKKLLDLIEELKTGDSLDQLRGLKKIEGYESYFRVRIGDYLLGVKGFRRYCRIDSLPAS